MYTLLGQRVSPSNSKDVAILNEIGTFGNHDSRIIPGGLRGFEPMSMNRKPYSTQPTPEEIRTQPNPTKYLSYNDINLGNIVYYVDGSLAQAYYKPVYSFTTPVDIKLFKDPMDKVYPEYRRVMPYTRANMWGNMFLQDSQYHREDIMALQQRKNNRSKIEALPIITD